MPKAEAKGIPKGMRWPAKPPKSEKGTNAGRSAASYSCRECVRLGIRADSASNSQMPKDYACDPSKPPAVCPQGHKRPKGGWTDGRS